MELRKQAISAEEFLEVTAQPKYRERNVELVEGAIVEMPTSNLQHAEILSRLTVTLGNFVYANTLGRIVSGDAGFILERNLDGRDSLRGVDLAFIRQAKAPEPLPVHISDLVPDLAVEILSPSNTALDINLKVKQLLKAGVQLVWVVDPQIRVVLVHGSGGVMELGTADTLTGGDVLPGFELPVADIFPV